MFSPARILPAKRERSGSHAKIPKKALNDSIRRRRGPSGATSACNIHDEFFAGSSDKPYKKGRIEGHRDG